MEVLDYVAKNSETEASRYFGISRTTLRGWNDLEKTPAEHIGLSTKKGKNKAGAGRPLSHGNQINEELCQWILERRDLNVSVSTKTIQRQAVEMIQPINSSLRHPQGG